MKKAVENSVLVAFLLTMILILGSCNKEESQILESINWEYMIVTFDSRQRQSNFEGFNNMGKEGWELVSFTGGSGGGFYSYEAYFKRKLR